MCVHCALCSTPIGIIVIIIIIINAVQSSAPEVRMPRIYDNPITFSQWLRAHCSRYLIIIIIIIVQLIAWLGETCILFSTELHFN